MQDILKLQQKIVPEVLELLQKRYNILRTVFYNQPLGRRTLANILGVGERIVRSEINFLKEQDLIKINTQGMYVTNEGEELIYKLKNYIHEIRGLTEVEDFLQKRMGIKKVIIVPGDVDEDITVLHELGRTAANYIHSLLKDDIIISLTGGTTVREVVENMPKVIQLKNVLVLPARGGMGTDVATQANTLVADLAEKIGADYKLLHIPDNLGKVALSAMLNEKSIREIVDTIHKSDILIYGIGRADEMALRRGFSEEKIGKIKDLGAVSEAFGYYYNKNGQVVYSTDTIGINNDDISKINTLIAVAGGKSKAEAIFANEVNNFNGILVTDEGAACEIINILS